ncbi:MAG: hypothetical protein K2L12_02600 [Clostridia bacterium]|nr:hypothetical protein [Clostridia bacterium]
MSEELIEDIRLRLDALSIYDIRQVAREVGVPQPTEGKKERLLTYIVDIATGTKDPEKRSPKGARPKSSSYDRNLVSDILKCREMYLLGEEAERDNTPFIMTVSSGSDPLNFNGEGLLEKSGEKWFIRAAGNNGDLIEVVVHDKFISDYYLREGDIVCGQCKRKTLEELAGLVSIISVNGGSVSKLKLRPQFDSLTPAYPDKQLKISCGEHDTTGRIIDLFSPVGKGQRAFITGARSTGKTYLLKTIAQGIQTNNPEVKLIFTLIDARPEEAADFRMTFPETDVFTSSFDAGYAGHVRTAKLALEYAKRRVEGGEDVVLLLDDIVRLTRSYNMCNKQFISAIDSSAIASVKKYLAAAKNTVSGGSLTIVATLGTGGGEDENAVFAALKDLCNMRIALSLELSRAHVRPAFDLQETYAVHEEKLLNSEQLKIAVSLRTKDIREIIKILESTGSDKQLYKMLFD